MRRTLAGFCIVGVWAGLLLAQAPESGSAIAAALLPLPEQLRAAATVVQLDAEFRPIVLRKGTNGMVCITDKPNDDRFDVR